MESSSLWLAIIVLVILYLLTSLIVSIVKKTRGATKSMASLNQNISDVRATRSKLEKELAGLADLKMDKEFKQLQEQINQALDQVPEESWEKGERKYRKKGERD